MAKLEPIIIDILFENGGIILEDSFIKNLSVDIGLQKEKIKKSIQKLIKRNKLYRLEDKYISLTDFGDTQEDKINELLNRLVYDKFLFKNPKLQNENEFCDNMVFFDGTVIVFQSKTKNYTKITEFDRFRKKCIDTAIGQLNTTINWIRNDAVTKKFKNNLGEEIEIQLKNVKKIIGVCVSYFHPDKDYFITKGNAINLKNKEEIANIITYQELVKIIEFNDTLPEFIEYLDKRRILVQKNVPLLSERKILSYFFSTNRTMVPDSISKSKFDTASLILMDDDFEDSLEKGDLSKKLKKRAEEDKDSYFIDTIINKILPKIPTDNDSFFVELLKLNRFQRRLIANQILPAYQHFILKKSDFRAPFISLNRDSNFLFLFSRKYQDPKINENMLSAYTAIMKKKHNANKIIGISENHYSNGMVNHNFCMMDGEIKFDESKLPDPVKQSIKDTSKVTQLKDLYEFDA